MSTVFRPPYATRIWVRGGTAAQGFVAGNRLALTATTAAPFAQLDWPNPRVARRAHAGFTNTFPLLLYGKDQFFAAPGEAPRYDYPNPLARKVQQPQGTASGLALTATPTASPFTQTNWPNPRLRVGWQIGVQFRSGALDVTPQQSDVPRIPYQVRIWPRNPQAAIGSQGPSNFLALTPVSVAAPFAQGDWPNPQVRRVQQPLNLPVLLQLYADGAGINGAYNEYLNPIVRRVQQPQDVQLSLALTATPPAAAPFVAQVFANPQRRRTAQPEPAGRSFDPGAVVTPTPFTPSDWPTPQRRRAQQPDSPSTRLPAIFAKPNVLSSFDMPVRRPAPRYDFRHTTFAAFVVIPPKPFLQTDWPNPTLKPFRYGLPTAALFNPSEIPIPPFWVRVPDTSETWTPIAETSESWSRVSGGSGTWTRISD